MCPWVSAWYTLWYEFEVRGRLCVGEAGIFLFELKFKDLVQGMTVNQSEQGRESGEALKKAGGAVRSVRRRRLSAEEYAAGILAGDRAVLSRAITLVESSLEGDRLLAAELLNSILPHTGKTRRIGITGVPGVGKSTFIDAFGTMLTGRGLKVAVLAVDPSSQRTGGSILGDKTRMDRLSRDPLAYVRPSPARGSLGGVTRKTREAMLLCEAAGFEVIVIETVGVGQSETAVHGMVDFFLLLMLSGAGDELQGIKKGIVEMADGISINKADGDNVKPARRARVEYESALKLFPPSGSGWVPQVLTCSALTSAGIPELWEMVETYYSLTEGNGWLNKKRQRQALTWLHDTIRHLLEARFFEDVRSKVALARMETEVLEGRIAPSVAGRELVRAFFDQDAG